MATEPAPTPNYALHALRDGLSCTLTLYLVTWFRLEHANLAVWTSHMVLSVYPASVFQRGLERTLGRGVGILAAVVLVTMFPDQTWLRLFIEGVLLIALFYVYFAGRFAYALLNAGLYLAVLNEMGNTAPEIVAYQGWEMFLAVLLGSLVADVVMWFSGAERDLHVDPGHTPLFPLHRDWLNHSVMMIATVFLTLFGCRYADLPISQSVIGVMMLTACTDVQAVVLKGELRLEGAILAIAYCLVAFVVLSYLPHLSLLAAFLFLGNYVAAYYAKVQTTQGYLGVQMGLVIPLLLVVPPGEIGSATAAVQRIQGVVIALGSSVVVAGLWPQFPLKPAQPTT